MLSTILALTVTWDPTIRGILVVVVGVGVLCGSTYLLVATNTGSRLGFLIAAAGLSGWMMIMGIIWMIYGIGMQGTPSHWEVHEVVESRSLSDLSAAALDEAHNLKTWTALPAGNTKRGEAETTATEALIAADGPLKRFEKATELLVLSAYDKGGKNPKSFINRIDMVPLPHPPHYAIVQVQRVIPVVTLKDGESCQPGTKCINFGDVPPKPEVDSSAPIISVVMERDLGSKRLPPAVIAFTSMVIFAVTCNAMHRRDKVLAEARG